MSTIPGLRAKGMSVSTVHRLMLPTRQSNTVAKYYHGVINARIPPKSNTSVANNHPDLHFCRTQIGYMNEMAKYFGVLRLSVDDKNKVNVRTLAVSRYHQIRRFFVVDDQPDYPDHDFAKIIPSGYLVMEKKYTGKSRFRSRSVSPARNNRKSIHKTRSRSLEHEQKLSADGVFKKDKLGRLHINFPRTGSLHVYNRASKFHSSTVR